MATKIFHIKSEDITLKSEHGGGGIATDKIVVDGLPVMYCYREVPALELDTGWRFFAGDESPDYLNNIFNSGVYSINTIANYDPTINSILAAPVGSEFEKDDSGTWRQIY